MKKVVFIIVAVALNYYFLNGQVTFEKTFGNEKNDLGEYVQQTSDEGFIVTGYSQDNLTFESDILLLKTDNFGNTDWMRKYQFPLNTKAYCVQEIEDGDFIIAGYNEDTITGGTDVLIIRTDNLGDTIWTRTFSNALKDRGHAIRQTFDNGFIITGFTCDSMFYDCDVYLIKINNQGETEWTKTIGGSDRDQSYNVEQTTDSGFIIVGSTFSFGNGIRDVYLIKTNNQGDTIFTKSYGGFNTDNGQSVKQTNEGGYIIVGTSISFNAQENHYDVYLIKTDEAGDTLWTRTYGGPDWESGKSIALTYDGGYIMTGYSESYGRGLGNVLVIKTDNSGDTIWTNTFGGEGTDWGKSIQQTLDGGYIIAGNTTSYGEGSNDIYLIKINGQGFVSINNHSYSNELTIFPNPAENTINIRTKYKTKIQIINLNGNIIYNNDEVMENDLLSINISNYSKGLYFVKSMTESFITVEKLIIK